MLHLILSTVFSVHDNYNYNYMPDTDLACVRMPSYGRGFHPIKFLI
jgi:hypothetical protein